MLSELLSLWVLLHCSLNDMLHHDHRARGVCALLDIPSGLQVGMVPVCPPLPGSVGCVCRDLVEQMWSDAALAALSQRQDQRLPLRNAYIHKAAHIPPLLGTSKLLQATVASTCVCLTTRFCMMQNSQDIAVATGYHCETVWCQQKHETPCTKAEYDSALCAGFDTRNALSQIDTYMKLSDNSKRNFISDRIQAPNNHVVAGQVTPLQCIQTLLCRQKKLCPFARNRAFGPLTTLFPGAAYVIQIDGSHKLCLPWEYPPWLAKAEQLRPQVSARQSEILSRMSFMLSLLWNNHWAQCLCGYAGAAQLGASG